MCFRWPPNIDKDRVCAAFKNVRKSVPSRWTATSKSTAYTGLHPDLQNLQLTTICRSEMFVAVDAGDRSAAHHITPTHSYTAHPCLANLTYIASIPTSLAPAEKGKK